MAGVVWTLDTRLALAWPLAMQRHHVAGLALHHPHTWGSLPPGARSSMLGLGRLPAHHSSSSQLPSIRSVPDRRPCLPVRPPEQDGDFLTPEEAATAPNVSIEAVSGPAAYYTLLALDPDAPGEAARRGPAGTGRLVAGAAAFEGHIPRKGGVAVPPPQCV